MPACGKEAQRSIWQLNSNQTGAAKPMNAATNPAATPRGGDRPTDPSMEEILASIRRIIADEQSAVQSPAPAPPPPVARAAVRPAAPQPPAAAAERPNPSEFEAWLAQTSRPQGGQGASVVPLQRHVEAAPSADNSAEAPFASQLPATPEAAPHYAVEEPVANVAPEVYAIQPEPEHQAPDIYHPVQEPEPTWHAPRLSVVAPADHAHEAHEAQHAPDADLDAPLRAGFDSGDLLSEAAGSSIQSSFQALARTMFMQNTGMVEEAVRDMLRPMLKQWLDDNLPPVVERLVRAEIERVARGAR
jgi:cell pole-organizing protein PopZ